MHLLKRNHLEILDDIIHKTKRCVISQNLRAYACHVGSHIWNHLTQVNVLCLNQSQAGWYSIYLNVVLTTQLTQDQHVTDTRQMDRLTCYSCCCANAQMM